MMLELIWGRGTRMHESAAQNSTALLSKAKVVVVDHVYIVLFSTLK